MRMKRGSLSHRRSDLRTAIPTSLEETSYHRWLCVLRHPELPSELVGRDAGACRGNFIVTREWRVSLDGRQGLLLESSLSLW